MRLFLISFLQPPFHFLDFKIDMEQVQVITSIY